MKNNTKNSEINIIHNLFTLPDDYRGSLNDLPISPLPEYFVRAEIMRNIGDMFGYRRSIAVGFLSISAN